ncbi:LacI family DNA-binding transcriptional regulator [Pseudaeromonas sharmana]|uniref:LacI family DNA-binding transcriptional regulator n=1 Tax=Pseudaeromonas sharmana TaxID=328412 RepID=A0ABV8CJ08_9GAMM
MATIKDVSRLANVSISTVSRVINNTAQVAPEKREAVLSAMKELNFRPNSFAQALVSKRSNCIGVLVGDLCGGPFFAQMMLGLERVIDRANKFTIVMSGNHDEQRERHAIEALLQRQCDALILHSKALPDEELLELTHGDTPIVFVNRVVPGAEERCVWLDNREGTCCAVRHLISMGHSKIAFVTSDDSDFTDAKQRFEGYKSGLEEAGIALDPQLVTSAYADEVGGHKAVEQLLERNVEFTAFVGFNDAMAAGGISCLMERGLQVPEQVSVVGFDDIPYIRFIRPKLTTVKYPIESIGEQAAELALRLLDGKNSEDVRLKFVPEMVVRDSVKQI